MSFSDVILERYLSNDVSVEMRARIDAALQSDDALQARVAALKEERAAFFKVDPPQQFAHRVATVVAVRKKPTPWLKWFVPVLSTAVLVLVAINVLRLYRAETVVPGHVPDAQVIVPPANEPAIDGGSSDEPEAKAPLDEEGAVDAPRVNERAAKAPAQDASGAVGRVEQKRAKADRPPAKKDSAADTYAKPPPSLGSAGPAVQGDGAAKGGEARGGRALRSEDDAAMASDAPAPEAPPPAPAMQSAPAAQPPEAAAAKAKTRRARESESTEAYAAGPAFSAVMTAAGANTYVSEGEPASLTVAKGEALRLRVTQAADAERLSVLAYANGTLRLVTSRAASAGIHTLGPMQADQTQQLFIVPHREAFDLGRLQNALKEGGAFPLRHLRVYVVVP